MSAAMSACPARTATKTKATALKQIGDNESLTEDEKHYLRYLLKVNNAFDAVLNHRRVILRQDLQKQYEKLVGCIDVGKADNYLCRQVRRINVRPHTDNEDGFSLSGHAYRYGDHGIYITVKEKRKRIFLPLTDNNQYKCQLWIKLFPTEDRIEIKVPINVEVRKYVDYQNHVGVAVGMYTMLTTDKGRCYGEELGRYQLEYSDWVRCSPAN